MQMMHAACRRMRVGVPWGRVHGLGHPLKVRSISIPFGHHRASFHVPGTRPLETVRCTRHSRLMQNWVSPFSVPSRGRLSWRAQVLMALTRIIIMLTWDNYFFCLFFTFIIIIICCCCCCSTERGPELGRVWLSLL